MVQTGSSLSSAWAPGFARPGSERAPRRLRALGQPPLALLALYTTVPLPGGQIKPMLRNVRRTQPLRFALGIHWLLEWGRF